VEFYDEEEDERAALYRLFASLFMTEPTDEMVEQVREMFQMQFNDPPQVIRMDFGNIFYQSDLHPAPYESLYNYPLEERPRLWGRATQEVLAFYRSAGLMVDEETGLIPDHLSMELLFMSYMIENGLEEQQHTFMEEHLYPWVPGYCDEIQKHAHTLFYQEVAELLKEFILSDYKDLRGGN
jgi:TorA maturation chaperone TorD